MWFRSLPVSFQRINSIATLAAARIPVQIEFLVATAYRGRFHILLGLLLGLLLLVPLLSGLFARALLIAMPIAGLYALSHKRQHLVIAFALVAPVLIGGWMAVRNSAPSPSPITRVWRCSEASFRSNR